MNEEPSEQLDAPRPARLADLLARIDAHPALLAVVRQTRRRLPGDDRYGDPLSLAGDRAHGVLAQRLALVVSERPSALKDLGFGALQVWQAFSEAQGRGRGEQELTILFTDLAGFSTWALDAGDTMAVELLRQVSGRVEPVVSAHDGRVVKRLGDGLMAVFRMPEDAVAAAVEAREELSRIEVKGHTPRLRAGIHVGKPRKIGGDYIGVDVNVAARVAEAAGAGEILISGDVRDRLGDEVSTRRRWLFSGKGTPAGTTVFVVA